MTTTEPSTASAQHDYDRLLASAIADLEASEPSLDELDRKNRDDYVYNPDVQSLHVSYRLRLKPTNEPRPAR